MGCGGAGLPRRGFRDGREDPGAAAVPAGEGERDPAGWRCARRGGSSSLGTSEREKESTRDGKSHSLTPAHRVPRACGSLLVWGVELERTIWNKSRVGGPRICTPSLRRLGNRKQADFLEEVP